MKSGWPDDGRDWDQEYYRIGLEQLVDRTFVQKTFVCYFRIESGYTCWENGDGLIVCDVCHEHVQGRSSPLSR